MPEPISDVIKRRRRGWRFRVANMGVMLAFFHADVPHAGMAVIFIAYVCHQLWELHGLPRLAATRLYTYAALVTFATGGLVFGSPALLWSLFVGMRGLFCGVFLLAGSALNSLLATKGCRRSLVASVSPFLLYLVFTTVAVVLPLYGPGFLLQAAVASGAMCVAGLKFWIDASRTSASELAAYQALERQRTELEDALQAAEAADQAKGEFLANMSHEIRTPLNGVLTTAEVLHLQANDPDQRRLLQLVRQSGRDLQRILNDVLDLSKISSGQMEIEWVAFDPVQEIESLLATFSPLAEQKGLQLEHVIAADARSRRLGDPVRLRQITANLVSNALKFTEQGSVRVVVSPLQIGREGLEIVVSDTGPGIAPDKMGRLFKRFSQVDGSTTRRFGGSGLGLAICRQLAELMGGEVWAESVEGVGSTFHACLPMAEVVVPPVTADRGAVSGMEAPLRPIRVLAADDNAANRLVLATVMKIFDFDLTVVENGLEAVQAWRDRDFDLILMDIQMPLMDGVAATQRIRAAELSLQRPRTPIIALSANAFAHQVESYLAAGMDGHLAKPIELARMQAVLQQHLMADTLSLHQDDAA